MKTGKIEQSKHPIDTDLAQASAFMAARDQRATPFALAWPPVLIALCLFGVALLPRMIGLADFLTTDEAYHWIKRTERFSMAIAAGEWHNTRLTGHPGVTLMWLGSLGLLLEQVATAYGRTAPGSLVEHLAWMRLPSALLQAMLVSLAYVLLRRLVTPTTAFIAALLWATTPYLIAHARLLHLDALLTSFVTISLLCVLIAGQAVYPRRWLVAGGLVAGLALLTKGPALILLPVVGLLLLWQVPAQSFGDRLRRAISHYLIWIGPAFLIVVLLWPAVWVVPGRALDKYVSEIIDNGGRPNGAGQFFLGRAVNDPGALFYPVANLFRMTPAITLGILLLPLALWRSGAERRLLLALGAFLAFWTLVMTLGPKKFDRYVLPTWPALLVLAAAGLRAIWELRSTFLNWEQRPVFFRRIVAGISLVLLIGLAAQPVLTSHPYYLSYYNPLIGGGAAAQRNLLIGWGEGMNQVGAFLLAQPDLDDGPVLSALPRTLQPFVSVPVKNIYELHQDTQNYAVVYLESLQRGVYPEYYAEIRQTVPVGRITIQGIDYAWIYQLPRAFAQPVNAQFGDALYLRGITITSTSEQILVMPAWDVRAPVDGDYQLFLHLIDQQGQRVAQIDVAPGGSDWPATSAWQPGQQIGVPLPLPLRGDLPSGEYRLIMGLYDVITGQRLALTAGTQADPALAGPQALLLDTLLLP